MDPKQPCPGAALVEALGTAEPGSGTSREQKLSPASELLVLCGFAQLRPKKRQRSVTIIWMPRNTQLVKTCTNNLLSRKGLSAFPAEVFLHKLTLLTGI